MHRKFYFERRKIIDRDQLSKERTDRSPTGGHTEGFVLERAPASGI